MKAKTSNPASNVPKPDILNYHTESDRVVDVAKAAASEYCTACIP